MAHTVYKNKDGKRVPSVTTIISNNLGWNKQMLIAWSKKIALQQGKDSKEIVDDAANVGTLTHLLIESKIKSIVPDISIYPKEDLKRAKNGYIGFCNWEKFWQPEKYVYSEIKLVSEQYQFGGTIDIVAEKNNNLHILDIKTSNYIHAEMAIQLAAYKRLFEENMNTCIDSMGIINLSKTNVEYKFFPVTDEIDIAAWDIFQNLLIVQNNKSKLSKFGKF